jgi:putative phosphoesterase
VGRGLLVAHVDDPYALEPAALVDRHHVPAGEREDGVDALGCDRLRREPASLPAVAHGGEPTLDQVLVLLGDTHLPRGSRRLPERCVELLRRAAAVVHTGDVVTAGALQELEAYAPVHAVHGNADEPSLRAALPERLVVELDGLRIGVVHSGGARSGRHERLRAWFPGCDVIAYGHSHLPEIANVDGTWIVNPGSPTERRRAPARTVAVVERGEPRLVEV